MFALALVAVVGITVLSLAHCVVPPILSEVAAGLTVGGAALSARGNDGS